VSKRNPTPLGGLTSIETDAIGEILNISMGASATAVSILLDQTVSITTPQVTVVEPGKFEYSNLEPAVGIEIEYIEGLNGSNIMIMSIKDVRRIVELLIGDESMVDSNKELDEMHMSALGEIMNQMMGAACTALASMLDMNINISTPKPFDLDERPNFYSSDKLAIVRVSFRLQVEGLLDSEFLTVMPIDFAKDLVQTALDMGGAQEPMEESAIPQEPATQQDYTSTTGHAQVPGVMFSDDLSHDAPSAPAQAPAQAPAAAPQQPKPAAAAPPPPQKPVVNVAPLSFGQLEEQEESVAPIDLGIVMDVELTVTVEIGRKRRQLKDVLELRQGSIIELDKQAGEPVDVVVNGQLIARGDVVVIDDNFGVRITEVIKKT
jgi:flagellar motor switch protein FliN/FliY